MAVWPQKMARGLKYLDLGSRLLDRYHLCGENKAADQTTLLHKSKISSLLPQNLFCLAIFCGCTDQLMLDLVGNPKDRFSHDTAHLSFRVYRRPTFVLLVQELVNTCPMNSRETNNWEALELYY